MYTRANYREFWPGWVRGSRVLEKLDPDLRLLLRKRQQPHTLAAAHQPTPEAETVAVIVQFTGPVEDLTKAGFDKMTVLEHKIEHYKVATGRIALAQLEALTSIDHVLDVEASRPLFPLLNYSRPEIRADIVQSGHPAFKGKDVIVGVIDSGIDWRHGAFRTADGKSRVLAVWDQAETKPIPGTVPGPGGLGVIYNDFAHPEKGTNLDTGGHGTHVSGIAAGNGRPACCFAGGGTYVGIAPEASIVVVRNATLLGQELGKASPSSTLSISSLTESHSVSRR